MKFETCVVTDYGTYPVSPGLVRAYLMTHGKKRSGRYTKKSQASAYLELTKDYTAMVRLYWTAGKDRVPKL